MDCIKQLILNRFKVFSLVSVSMLLSIVLLMIRMKLTHSFFYLFLVWNLFLAVIPFAITSYLVSLPKLNKLSSALWFGLWLLFLPNSPYIITDLLHLKNKYKPLVMVRCFGSFCICPKWFINVLFFVNRYGTRT